MKGYSSKDIKENILPAMLVQLLSGWVLQGGNCQKLIFNWATCQWTTEGKGHSHPCVYSF